MCMYVYKYTYKTVVATTFILRMYIYIFFFFRPHIFFDLLKDHFIARLLCSYMSNDYIIHNYAYVMKM